MALDCSDISPPVTNNCTEPWGVGCTTREGFRSTSLWNYTRNIQAACANDSRLYGGFATAQNASLTQSACVDITGKSWTYYPTSDIWNRLTTWKFPLLQLVATFPRPPLSFKVECFVILHLLGDPVDTIRNLILKMSTCQHTASFWKTQCKTSLGLSSDVTYERSEEDPDRNWKALALITDAYGEWNKGGMAQTVLHEALAFAAKDTRARDEIMTAVRRTGRALAADRSTKFLPIVVAQIFFIATVGIAIFRTAASAGGHSRSDTVFVNLEIYSIAKSAQYFWIIPAVFLSSVIGVSQTEAAIPRILRRFQLDLDRVNASQKVQMPNKCLDDDHGRIFKGGIYSWQPLPSSKPLKATQLSVATAGYERLNESSAPATSASNMPVAWEAPPTGDGRSRPSDNGHVLFPYPIMVLGTLTGMLVCAFVPPEGWSCRQWGEILICIAWLLSAQIDVLFKHQWGSDPRGDGTLLWMTFVKDLVFTAATMGGVVVTQIGVYNRCSCYTRWGATGLALPEQPDLAITLLDRLNTLYPAIIFTSIVIQLVLVPLYFCKRYPDAVRVYLQRDDRKSNAPWVWTVQMKCKATCGSFFKSFPRSQLDRFTHRRVGTSRSTMEQGSADQSQELQISSQSETPVPQDQSQVSTVEPSPPSGRDMPRRRDTNPPAGCGE